MTRPDLFLVHPHCPLPVTTLIALPHLDAVSRAASLVGMTQISPLALDLESSAQALAVTRAYAEQLLTRLQMLYPACPSCLGTARDFDCAGELGVLEERIASVASRSRICLEWTLAAASGR